MIKVRVCWRIWKNKPWLDKWWRWRTVTPEFTHHYISLKQAWLALLDRKDDGAKCIIMPFLLIERNGHLWFTLGDT